MHTRPVDSRRRTGCYPFSTRSVMFMVRMKLLRPGRLSSHVFANLSMESGKVAWLKSLQLCSEV
jgi:hypothetical protein